MMNRLQLFKYATAGLLLLNIAMIVFFLLSKPNPPGRGPRPGQGQGGAEHRFQQQAIEILNLDPAQEEAFDQLVEAHSMMMDSVKQEQRLLLKPFFETLIDTTISTQPESVYQQVQALEREKIAGTYQHFKEVQNLLRDEQKADFQRFTKRALEVMFFSGEKRPPPPKDF